MSWSGDIYILLILMKREREREIMQRFLGGLTLLLKKRRANEN